MEFDDTFLKLTLSSTIEDAWDIYSSTMSHFGFDRIIYGRTSFRNGFNLGDSTNHFILSNHDPAYINFFVEEFRFQDSPMFKWSFDNVGCASWSLVMKWIEQGKLSDEQLAVVEGNKKFGVSAGYTISYPNPVSTRNMSSASLTAKIGLSQEDVDNIWDKYGKKLEILSYIFDMKVSSLPHLPEQVRLTKRQREVLEWIGDGKTIQDTAVIMNLTSATVEKHLRLARDALNVDTTAQAVLKASLMNQMYMG